MTPSELLFRLHRVIILRVMLRLPLSRLLLRRRVRLHIGIRLRRRLRLLMFLCSLFIFPGLCRFLRSLLLGVLRRCLRFLRLPLRC